MKRVLINAILVVVTLATMLVQSQVAFAAWNPFGSSCSGAAANSAVCSTAAPSSKSPIRDIIVTATNIVAVVAGVAAIIVILVSGFRFITSSGNSSNVEGARNTLMYAVIGLVVIVAARTIVVYAVSHIK